MKLESDSKSLVQVERKTVKILSQAKMEDKSGDLTTPGKMEQERTKRSGIKRREREPKKTSSTTPEGK